MSKRKFDGSSKTDDKKFQKVGLTSELNRSFASKQTKSTTHVALSGGRFVLETKGKFFAQLLAHQVHAGMQGLVVDGIGDPRQLLVHVRGFPRYPAALSLVECVAPYTAFGCDFDLGYFPTVSEGFDAFEAFVGTDEPSDILKTVVETVKTIYGRSVGKCSLSISRGKSASTGWNANGTKCKFGLHLVFCDLGVKPKINKALWSHIFAALQEAFPAGFAGMDWATIFDASVHGKAAGSPCLRMIFCDKIFRTPNDDKIWERRPKLPYVMMDTDELVWQPENDFRTPQALAELLAYVETEPGVFERSDALVLQNHAWLVSVIQDYLIRRDTLVEQPTVTTHPSVQQKPSAVVTVDLTDAP
ncbi:MAG: hypothetical protein CMP20_15390 [Rickettsiales bacterium]|nr:hypothetical protein [Rickettsiales bacterium]